MLVLSRRIGEALLIGDEITITILDITGSQVRIGIDAPRDVPVWRDEIYDQGPVLDCTKTQSDADATSTATVPDPDRVLLA